MLAEQVDVAVHPPLRHPLDPFTGRLITRRDGERVEIVEADRQILLDCGFLWDIVANAAVFAPWCTLAPPEAKLDLESNFDLAPGVALLSFEVPTNRPVQGSSYPMCQHWLLVLTVGSRTIAYRIGAYRPSVNAMEATQA